MLGAPLLVTAEQDAAVPEQDRRDADPRIGPHETPDEPKPRLAALGGGQLGHLHHVDGYRRHDEQLGDAHAGLDRERVLALGVEQDHPHLSAIPRVDHPGRVDEGDAVPRGEAGARHDEAGVPLRDLDREPVATTARSPGAIVTASHAVRSSPASPARAREGSTASALSL